MLVTVAPDATSTGVASAKDGAPPLQRVTAPSVAHRTQLPGRSACVIGVVAAGPEASR